MFQPCFNWEEENTLFKGVEKITDENREKTMTLIRTIGQEANQIPLSPLKVHLKARRLAAKMCKHATDLLEEDEQDDKARLFEDLASNLSIPPFFGWSATYSQLNPNVTQARTSEERPDTMAIIQGINRELSAQLQIKQSGLMPPSAMRKASDTCAHAAWILILERNKSEAKKHIQFALQFEVTGFAKYIASAVKRGTGDMQGALDCAKDAIQLFREAEESDLVLAHGHIQAGLAALRLNRNEEAKAFFEQARILAETPTSASHIKSYAECAIMGSEGAPLSRMLMNLAQVYNKLGQHEDALACLQQIPQPDTPLGIAYSNNVFAEAYIGLQKYEQARTLLEASYNYYVAEDMAHTDNCFRNMLGRLEVNLACNEPLVCLDEISTLYKKLKYAPNHDFRLRLDAIFERLEASQKYKHYLNVIEVNLELEEAPQFLEHAKALQLELEYSSEHELTQRLNKLIEILEAPIGLEAISYER